MIKMSPYKSFKKIKTMSPYKEEKLLLAHRNVMCFIEPDEKNKEND